jgi:hypothetical protein
MNNEHPSNTTPSNRKLIRTLLVANAVVGAAIAGVAFTRHAKAQESVRPADIRARGDYTMVSGKSNAGGPSVIYVVDSANQEIVALRWDQAGKAMSGIGYRSLQNDGRAARGR